MSGLPADFFHPPPGPMIFFDGFPPEYLLHAFHYTLVVALIFLCLGFFTKAASIGTGILLLVLQGFIFSLGKINHDLMLVAVPLVMAFSGWGAAYSVDAQRKDKSTVTATGSGWTLTLMALITGFMFFTAGFPKILGGWLDWMTQAAEGHYFKQFFVRGRQDLLASYGQHIGSFWWELFDYGTVLFEVGFLAAIFNPRSTRIFMGLAVLFHSGTMLLLNISFVPNFLAYAAFLNWTWIDAKATNQSTFSSGLNRRRPPVLVALFMILLFAVSRLWENYFPALLRSDWGTDGAVIVLAAMPFAVYYLIKELRIFIK